MGLEGGTNNRRINNLCVRVFTRSENCQFENVHQPNNASRSTLASRLQFEDSPRAKIIYTPTNVAVYISLVCDVKVAVGAHPHM